MYSKLGASKINSTTNSASFTRHTIDNKNNVNPFLVFTCHDLKIGQWYM